MLGKYDGSGETSYIQRADLEGATHFDLSEQWGIVKKDYGLTDDQMFDIFNIPVLDEAIARGKTIKFSHDPRLESVESALLKEWRHLKDHGYTDLEDMGGFFHAVK